MINQIHRCLLVHNNASKPNSSAHLSSKLDDLLRSIKRAESMRASADGERELADDRLAFGCLEQCTRMAREVVSSASSVIGETARPMRPGVRELPGLHELPGGSDYGGFSNTRAWIEGWISGPAPEDVAEESILSSEGRASTSQSFTSSRDVMSDTTWTTRSNSQNRHGNNLDLSYNQDVELFQVFVRMADEMYKSKMYAKAESYYRKVLETSEKLQTETIFS
jgi:hypothetical protein